MVGQAARAALVLSAALTFLGTPVQGQRSTFTSEQVPRDFVLAVLETQPGTVPELLIGEMPRLLAPRVPLPPGGRVLGSVIRSANVTVLVETTALVDSVRAFYVRELPRPGWSIVPTPSSGGFRSPRQQLPVTACAGDEALVVSFVPRASAGTLVRLIALEANASACRRPSAVTQPVRYGRPMPLLLNPEGADTYGCRSPGVSATSVMQFLRTDMGVPELLAHYARQLRDSGWTDSRSQQPPMATQSWVRARRDSTSASGRVALAIVQDRERPECKQITLEVRPEGER